MAVPEGLKERPLLSKVLDRAAAMTFGGDGGWAPESASRAARVKEE